MLFEAPINEDVRRVSMTRCQMAQVHTSDTSKLSWPMNERPRISMPREVNDQMKYHANCNSTKMQLSTRPRCLSLIRCQQALSRIRSSSSLLDLESFSPRIRLTLADRLDTRWFVSVNVGGRSKNASPAFFYPRFFTDEIIFCQPLRDHSPPNDFVCDAITRS